MASENKHKNQSVKCVHCKSSDYTKRGYRKTENRGKVQRYYCKNCERCFTNDDGFYRMRFNPKTITMSIDMYLSNLSSRKMRNQLSRHFSIRASHITILDWVRKYSLKVHKFVEQLQYNLGREFFADETEITRLGHRDKFWACVDWHTRMITGIHYSTTGNTEEAIEFIQKSIKKGKPHYIQTDSAKFYPRAFRKAFYNNRLGGLSVQHKIQNVRRTKVHNYKIETVFMKIKDRVDDFRGFKALWSAPIIMAGLTIQHNFIEPHNARNEHPCKLAGTQLELGDNRWLGLINLSSCSS